VPHAAASSRSESFERHEIEGAASVLHRSSRAIHFHEVDAAGIVFYARFFEYFHDALVDYFSLRGIDTSRAFTERRWRAPFVHAEADYLKPVRFGERIEVHVVAARVGRSSARVAYRVVSESGVCAIGQSVQVYVGGDSFERIEVPADIRAALCGEAASG
jgi:YbgC/YbaW family acyl-CoA thioester hydrolase